jgi:5'-3' exonuclease
VPLWEKLTDSALHICRHQSAVELAIYFEHHAKDFKKALQAAQKAAKDDEISEKEAEKLQVRIARLRRKYSS